MQINLLSEHEITRLLSVTIAIAKKCGVELRNLPELSELERDVAPETVLDEIEKADELGAPLAMTGRAR